MYQKTSTDWKGSGLFCRMPSLSSNFMNAMRFGLANGNTICKFSIASSWAGEGMKLRTHYFGSVDASSCGYDVGEDFYLTFIYVSYDKTASEKYQNEHEAEYKAKTGNYDQTMDDVFNSVTLNGTDLSKTNYIDKVLYYVNGELYGYTYYGHDSYLEGCKTWNATGTPFFVGVCPWMADGNLYYLKGSVYTCRLYQSSMTGTQVLENMNATKQYRASF